MIRSEPAAPAPPILELELERVSDRYDVLRHGGGGPATTLICGAVRFDHPAARNLVGILPEIVHVEPRDAPAGGVDRISTTLGLMAAEARELRPGGEAVITRLTDILVIHAIRAWIDRAPDARSGWLGALRR